MAKDKPEQGATEPSPTTQIEQAAAPSTQQPAVISVEALATFARIFAETLRAPSEEEKALIKRKREERAALIREQAQALADRKALQENCPHVRATSDGRRHSTITAIHNFPDGMPRGICLMCQDVMEPGHKNYQEVLISHQAAMMSAQSVQQTAI